MRWWITISCAHACWAADEGFASSRVYFAWRRINVLAALHARAPTRVDVRKAACVRGVCVLYVRERSNSFLCSRSFLPFQISQRLHGAGLDLLLQRPSSCNARRSQTATPPPPIIMVLVHADSPPKRAYAQLWQSTRVATTNETVELHTPAALRLRAALRIHPSVVAVLEQWWAAAQSTMGGASCLNQDTYVLISKAIYGAIVDDPVDEEATENALDEWKDEAAIAAGAKTLTGNAFMDGIFELADIHTEHIDWQEYTTFLSDLLLKVTVEDSHGRRHFSGATALRMENASPHKRQHGSAPASPLRGAKRFGQALEEEEVKAIPSKKPKPVYTPRPAVAKPRRRIGREYTSSIGMLTGTGQLTPDGSPRAPPIKPFEEVHEATTPASSTHLDTLRAHCHLLNAGQCRRTGRINLVVKPESLDLLEFARKAGERAAASTSSVGTQLAPPAGTFRTYRRPTSAMASAGGQRPKLLAAVAERRPATAPVPPVTMLLPIPKRDERLSLRARLGPAMAGGGAGAGTFTRGVLADVWRQRQGVAALSGGRKLAPLPLVK